MIILLGTYTGIVQQLLKELYKDRQVLHTDFMDRKLKHRRRRKDLPGDRWKSVAEPGIDAMPLSISLA